MSLPPLPKTRTPSRRPGTSRRGPIPIEDDIFRLVVEAIVTKQIRPGSRLKESALAEQFGVSRSRVRAVLQRLSELDIVEFSLNQGALVRRPAPEESRAVFAMRRLLEAEAVRETCKRATPTDYQRLRALLEREGQAFKNRERGVALLSSGFHLLLGEMCGNPVLARILNQLVHQCVLIQSLYERQTQDTICLVDEHAQIIDLMEQRKAKDAAAAMLHHINHIEANLDYESLSDIDERLALAMG